MRCCKCKQDKPPTDFTPSRLRQKVYGRSVWCRSCRVAEAATPGARASRKKTYAKLRSEVLSAYGGKCACCGEATNEFLGIDHINGRGKKHRQEEKAQGGRLYQLLKNQGYPQGAYQILCHNCNLAKGFYGKCPHVQ